MKRTLVKMHSLDGHLQPDLRAVNEQDLNYELRQTYVFKIDNDEFFIVKGFRTDLASVPAKFQWLINDNGVQDAAALIHDYIARNEGVLKSNEDVEVKFSRHDNDRIFLQALKKVGIKSWKARLMYWGVRAYSKLKGKWQ